MKTVATVVLTAVMFLLPWCSASLFAQQANPSGDKKIVITKRITDANGAETTETIIKKGKSAENFDADTYLQENESDNVQIRIREESEGGRNIRITTSDEETPEANGWEDLQERLGEIEDDVDDVDWDELQEKVEHIAKKACQGLGISMAQPCTDGIGFLGVQPAATPAGTKEGVVTTKEGVAVKVIRGSGAEKAGLQNNDVLLKLNETPINKWSDLTAFMAKTKPGEQVNITYSRAGTAGTAAATLSKGGSTRILNCVSGEKRGFLGVSPEKEEKDEAQPGVKVSISKESGAAKAGLADGDRILQLNDVKVDEWEDVEDFMADTKSGDKIRVTYERNGTTQTTEATLGAQKSLIPTSWNWTPDAERTLINSREKEACLGVYSAAFGEGTNAGSKVDNFTEESAARDQSMQVGDVITSVNAARVKSHDELWNEIARYKPGETVKVDFLRGDTPLSVQATLKACRDRNRVSIVGEGKEGEKELRHFYTWNWGEREQERLRTRRVITIHRGGSAEGDAPKTETPAPAQPSAQERSLQLNGFRAYPNPTSGQITVEFHAEAVPTNLALLDISGRQLFSEELNAFNGDYNQQFDLSEYAKGTIILRIQQGEKVFTEQIVVN